jgi:Skp family chaperone for outer membrane proteins
MTRRPRGSKKGLIQMKLARLLPVALVAAVLLMTTPAPAQTAQARIAIANPARIFTEIQQTRDLQAKFKNELDAVNTERQQRELKLNDTRAARDSLKPDSPQWAERNQELVRLAVEYEVWQRMMQAELERQQKQQMRVIFDQITEAVGRVASQRGIELVIAEVRPDLPDTLDQINVNDLRARLVSRNVLFNAPQVDISNDVIAEMDARYRAGQ